MQDVPSRSAQSNRLDAIAPPSGRVVITNVYPEIDGGGYPAKVCVGDTFVVGADIISDGHDLLAAVVRYRSADNDAWLEIPMRLDGNDYWSAEILLRDRGGLTYTVEAWRDVFGTWCHDAKIRDRAGQALDVELLVARQILADAVANAPSEDARSEFARLLFSFDALDGQAGAVAARLALLTEPEVGALFARVGPRSFTSTYPKELKVMVERRSAAFSAWYELMPRSQSGDAARHGTFDDVIARLPYVRDMGFDVLYFPPVHPIGRTHRKGPNNALTAGPNDHGSPYAIGAAEGGHDALHPELGSFDDFARLIAAAKDHGLEIALDFAIQCSPDHPWISQHPEWFDWRPDGTIRFAENPPKKYEDIVNVRFYGDAFPDLWLALRDVVLFWVDRGVNIFRVDNPHTKPFPFWEWLIREVQTRHPDVIFLAEAFTRPKIMQQLAKIGFTQSYSYFTWRNTKPELTAYLKELTQGPSRHYMRPNFFVNTPDINPFYLQTSGRAGFQARLVLAATLGGNYGIYSGFELCEAAALPGKEEYLDSEKYQIRAWDWDRPGNIKDDIARINALRRSSPALQEFCNVTFYNAWNDDILYYGKATADKSDFLLFAVNLDPENAQGAHFEVPLWEFGLADDASIDVENLMTGERITWTGKVQHMLLDPKQQQSYAMWRLFAPKDPA
ncbi:MAG: alpha-1,4-glucan--maltose-1-phosphate maltosyltransferase [Hyphomicrobiaceae bacterium]|nr:alpha-1,4-glucan--maltose-1-phosphate maltosyltransferase [Hyphomicrobiaceae bacterium]